MIVIGTASELGKADALSEEVKNDIAIAVSILDNEYGSKRDIYKDIGGFVAVADDVQDLDYLIAVWKLNIRTDICEYEEAIGGYVKRLYMLSSDYAILLYVKEELI